MARDYKKEYASYHSKPEQKKKRAMRNTARRKLEKKGVVSKGDGKDVDHRKPLRSGGSNGGSNLRVRSKSANRADNGGRGGRKPLNKNK
jgi:hypothetical protein